LPRISKALQPFRDDILMLAGLTHNGGRALGDGPGDHGRAGANYLTGVHPKKTNGRELQAGVSVDQIAAQHLSGKTRFASLELGCEEGVQGGSCDNGYSCAYGNSISWWTPASPNPAEIRPRAVFERLFGTQDNDPPRLVTRRVCSIWSGGRRRLWHRHWAGRTSESSTNICTRFAIWRSGLRMRSGMRRRVQDLP